MYAHIKVKRSLANPTVHKKSISLSFKIKMTTDDLSNHNSIKPKGLGSKKNKTSTSDQPTNDQISSEQVIINDESSQEEDGPELEIPDSIPEIVKEMSSCLDATDYVAARDLCRAAIHEANAKLIQSNQVTDNDEGDDSNSRAILDADFYTAYSEALTTLALLESAIMFDEEDQLCNFVDFSSQLLEDHDMPSNLINNTILSLLDESKKNSSMGEEIKGSANLFATSPVIADLLASACIRLLGEDQEDALDDYEEDEEEEEEKGVTTDAVRALYSVMKKYPLALPSEGIQAIQTMSEDERDCLFGLMEYRLDNLFDMMYSVCEREDAHSMVLELVGMTKEIIAKQQELFSGQLKWRQRADLRMAEAVLLESGLYELDGDLAMADQLYEQCKRMMKELSKVYDRDSIPAPLLQML